MDWEFITHHLISGYIVAATALSLYFIILRIIKKKQSAVRIVASFVFFLYLVGMLTVTGICIRPSFSPQIVYIPFVDMARGPIEAVLNIFLFLPMGIFLPLLYNKYDKVGKIALTGLIVSLSIEIIQIFGFGTSDVNDLITNTLGVCLGYGIYKLLYKFVSKSLNEKIQIDGSKELLGNKLNKLDKYKCSDYFPTVPKCFYEPISLWLCALIIMITVQPYIFVLCFR